MSIIKNLFTKQDVPSLEENKKSAKDSKQKAEEITSLEEYISEEKKIDSSVTKKQSKKNNKSSKVVKAEISKEMEDSELQMTTGGMTIFLEGSKLDESKQSDAFSGAKSEQVTPIRTYKDSSVGEVRDVKGLKETIYAPSGKIFFDTGLNVRSYRTEKKVNILEIIISGSGSDFEQISKIIAEKTKTNLVRIFIVDESHIRMSRIFDLSEANLKRDIIAFLMNVGIKDSPESKNFDTLNDALKQVKEDKFVDKGLDLNYIYRVQNIKVIFYGFSYYILEKLDRDAAVTFDEISSEYETSFYMLNDDTVKLASLGFRNLYLIDRMNYEGVK